MRKSVNGSAAALMVLPCLAWGLQPVFIKYATGDMAPLLQVALRSVVAAFLVWSISRLVFRDRWLKGTGRAGAVVGLFYALDFLFTAEGLRWTSASHISVFLFTGPLFAAIGLHWRLVEERMMPRQWMGMVVAFAGIAITFLMPGGARQPTVDLPHQLWGDFLGICAGISWGATTVAIRLTKLSDAPATQTLFYQLAVSAAILLPLAFLTGQSDASFTPMVWTSLGFQAVIAAFVANLMWFWLLTKYYAAQLGVLSYMSPLFGVAFGVSLLNDELSPAFLVGAILVLIGIVMVSCRKAPLATPQVAG